MAVGVAAGRLEGKERTGHRGTPPVDGQGGGLVEAILLIETWRPE